MATEADIPDPTSLTKRDVEDKELISELSNTTFNEVPLAEKKKVEDAQVVNEGNVGTIEGEIFLKSPSVADEKPERITEENQLNTDEELSGLQEEEKGCITDKNIIVEASYDQDAGVIIQTPDLAESLSVDIEKLRGVSNKENMDNVSTKTTSIEQDLRETNFEGEDEKSKISSNSLGTEMDLETIQPSNDIENERNKGEEMLCDDNKEVCMSKETAGAANEKIEAATESGEGAKDKLRSSLVTATIEETSSAKAGPDVGDNLEENTNMACKDRSQETVELSEKMKDVTTIEDEVQTKKLESSFVDKAEDISFQKVDNLETFKEEYETGMKYIVKESQNEAHDQNEILENIATTDSNPSTTSKVDENPEPKADVSFKPKESIKESEDLTPPEALTMECKHDGLMVVAGEDNIVYEEMDKTETSKHEEHSAQSFMQKNEPAKANPGSPLNIVCEEIETTASNENAEMISNIEGPVGIPQEILGEIRKDETVIADDINKEEIPEAKNISIVDSDEKTRSGAEVEIPKTNGNDLYVTHPPIEETVLGGEKQDKVSMPESGDQFHEAIEVPQEEEKHVNEAYEASKSPESTILEHTSTEAVLNMDMTSTREMGVKLEKELKEINVEENIEANREQKETASDTRLQIATKSDDNEKSTIEEDIPVKNNTPLCTGEEEYHHDQEDRNEPNSSKEASTELDSGDQSCGTSNETKNINDEIINEETIQVYEEPKIADRGEDEKKEMKSEEHDVMDHSPESTDKVEDISFQKVDNLETFKEESETGIKYIVKESQNEADDQNEILENIATSKVEENPEPKADDSFKPKESIRESEDLTPPEALTMECKHDGLMVVAGEDNIVYGEMDKTETSKHEEHSAQSFMQKNEPAKANLGSPLNVACEDIETTASNENAETISNIEGPVGIPQEILGETRKDETVIADDINKEEIPEAKNISTVDSDEKTRSRAEVEIPKKNVNDLYVTHPPIEETVLGGEKQDKVSMPELGDQFHEAIEVPKEEEKHVNEAYEASKSPESTILEHTSTEAVLNMDMTSTREMGIKLEKELKEINVEENIEAEREQKETASDTRLQIATKSDDNEKSTIEEDIPVKNNTPLCAGEEEYHHDQEDRNEPNSSTEASTELDSGDHSCGTSNETKNINDQIINEEVYEAGRGEDEKKEMKNEEHTVMDHSPESSGSHTTKCSQENETDAEMHKAKMGEELEAASKGEGIEKQVLAEESRVQNSSTVSAGEELGTESPKEDSMKTNMPKEEVLEMLQIAGGSANIGIQTKEEDGTSHENFVACDGEEIKNECSYGKENDEKEPDIEVWNSNIECIERAFDITHSTKEREAYALKDEAETSEGLNTITGSSEETTQKESNLDLIENSSSGLEISHKEIEEDILEKSYSEVTVVAEETSLIEAEAGYKMQVDSSNLVSKEKGLVTTEISEMESNGIDIIKKPTETSSLDENEAMEIQTARKHGADGTAEKSEPEGKNETCDTLSKTADQREVTTVETSLDDISEENLQASSTLSLEEHNIATPDASEATGEAPGKDKTLYASSETPLVAETTDEGIMEKEDESINKNNEANSEKESANDDTWDEDKELNTPPQLKNEHCISESDVGLLKRENTSEVANCSEIDKLETSEDESNTGIEKDISEYKMEVDEASKGVEACGGCIDNEKAILEQEEFVKNIEGSSKESIEIEKAPVEFETGGHSHGSEASETKSINTLTEKNIETVEHGENHKSAPESMAEDKSNMRIPETNQSNIEEESYDDENHTTDSTKEQISGQDIQEESKNMNEEIEHKLETQKEINKTQDTILNEKVPMEIERAVETEIIKEQTTEEESCTKELHMIPVADETVNEVTDVDFTSIRSLDATASTNNTEMVKSKVAEDLNQESEASPITKAMKEDTEKPIEKPVDVSSSVSEVSEEKVKEEKIEDTENFDGDTDIAPTVVTDITSLREVQLNDEPVKAIDTSSDAKSLEATKTADTSQQDAEVDSMKIEETSSMVFQIPVHKQEKADNESITAEKSDANDLEVEETKFPDAISESKDQGVEEIHETDTNETEKQTTDVPEALPQLINQGIEAASDDEIIPPTVATEVTSLGEVQLNDEPEKALDASSDAKSLERTTTADISQQDAEVDSLKLEETASMVHQLPMHEHEKADNESLTAEKSDANDDEAKETKIPETVAESKDQGVKEIHETDTSLIVGVTDTNEIEKQIGEVPEALSDPINKGAEAARDDEITLGQTLQAEKIEEQLQVPSSSLISKEQDSETKTTIEKSEDGSMKKDDTEVDNLKLIESYGMVSELPITECESANNETVEKSDADEVEAKETETLDAVSESKDQGFREIHETRASPITENTETDKIEEVEVNENISDPRYLGVDTVADGETSDRPLPFGKLEEQLQVSSSALNCEARTTIMTEDESTKKNETEVDKIEPEESTGMLFKSPTIEHENTDKMSAIIEKSDADEVQVEEAKTYEAISDSKVEDAEQIQETVQSKETEEEENKGVEMMCDSTEDNCMSKEIVCPDNQKTEAATECNEAANDKLGSSLLTAPIEDKCSEKVLPDVGGNLEENSSKACEEGSQETVELSEKMKDVTSIEDEVQNKSFESSLVKNIEDSLQKADDLETSKEECESGMKDIVNESQNEADNQNEILENNVTDSNLSTTGKDDEIPEPKADVSFRKPNESMDRESEDISSTEALTMECQHEGIMVVAGEDNIVAEEQDKPETSNHEENFKKSFMQETEPAKANLGSPLDVASEEIETTAPNEYAETITNIEERGLVRIPQEILEETRKDGTITADEINKSANPEAKNISTVDLDEKTRSTEIEIPNKNDNELHITHRPIEETVQVRGEKQDEVSMSESGDQLHKAFEVPMEEEKQVNEAYEASKSPESTILEHTSTEGALNIDATSTSELDINLEKACELNSEKEVKEINAEENIKEEIEQKEKDSDTEIRIATKSDDNEKSTIEEDVPVKNNTPLCTGEEEHHHDQEDTNGQNSSEEASTELDSGDQSCSTSKETKNINDQIINEETIQVYEDPKTADGGEDAEKETKNEEHTVMCHSPDFIGKHTTTCSQENETEAKRREAEMGEELETTNKSEGTEKQVLAEENRVQEWSTVSAGEELGIESPKEDAMKTKMSKEEVLEILQTAGGSANIGIQFKEEDGTSKDNFVASDGEEIKNENSYDKENEEKEPDTAVLETNHGGQDTAEQIVKNSVRNQSAEYFDEKTIRESSQEDEASGEHKTAGASTIMEESAITDLPSSSVGEEKVEENLKEVKAEAMRSEIEARNSNIEGVEQAFDTTRSTKEREDDALKDEAKTNEGLNAQSITGSSKEETAQKESNLDLVENSSSVPEISDKEIKEEILEKADSEITVPEISCPDIQKTEEATERSEAARDKLGSSLLTAPIEDKCSEKAVTDVGGNLEENSSKACEEGSQETVELSEEMKDVTSIEDEVQNKNLESSLVKNIEDSLQKADDLETSKEECETGMKDIVTESQNEADNQNEILENNVTPDSNLSTTGKDDETLEPKADVSFRKPNESMGRESEDISPTEALTMDCQHEGVMVVAGEDNIVAEEQDKPETSNQEEHLKKSFMQETEPAKANLGSPLDVASEEIETIAPNEYAETITKIEEQRQVGIPQEILGETRKDETITADEINKNENPEAKNISTVDLDEKTRSTEAEILNKNDNESHVAHPPIEETVQVGGEKRDEVSMSESGDGDQLHEAFEVPMEEEKHVNEAYEASKSPESTILEHTSTEGALNMDVTSTSELDISLEKDSELNSEKEVKEINDEENKKEEIEQTEKASDTEIQIATKSDDNEKSTIEEDAPVKNDTPLCTGEEEYHHDQEDKNWPNSSIEASTELDSGDQSCRTSNATININDQIINEETIQVYEDPKIADRGEDTEKEMKNEDHTVMGHAPEFIGKDTTCSQENETEARKRKAEMGEELETTNKSEGTEKQVLAEENKLQDWSTVSAGEELCTESPKEDAMKTKMSKEEVFEILQTADGSANMGIQTKEEDHTSQENFVACDGEEIKNEYSYDKKNEEKEPDTAVLETNHGGQETAEQIITNSVRNQSVKSLEEKAVRESSQEDEASKEHETAGASTTMEESAITDLLSSSEEEKVEENLKEVKTEAMGSEKEVRNSNIECIERAFDTMHSTKEREANALKDEAETSEGLNAQSITGSSEETTQKESNLDLIENSSSVLEISHKEIKEDILEKSYSQVTVVAEETSLIEAEAGYKMQVDSSSLVSKEKGLATTETSEMESNGIDIINKPAETSSLDENEAMVIQTARKHGADGTAEKTEPEGKNETCDTLSKTADQREVATVETSLDDISEENLQVSSTLSSEEHNFLTPEVSETTGEAPEKDKTLYGKAETPIVAETTKEDIIEKEDESTNPKNDTNMGPIEIEKETANDDAQNEEQELYTTPELNNEKSKSESDVELLKSINTSEVPDCSEIGKLETLEDEKLSDIGLEKDKSDYETAVSEASKGVEMCGRCMDTEKAILEHEDSSKNFEGNSKGSVEIKKAQAEIEAGGEDSETKSTSTLAEKEPWKIETAAASEIINEQTTEEESSTKEPQMIAVVDETVNEVAELDLTPIQSLETTAPNNNTDMVKSKVAEDLNQESEASPMMKALEEKIKEPIEKPVDVSSSVSEVSEENIKKEIIEDTENCHDDTNIAPTVVTDTTSLGEVQLNDEPVKTTKTAETSQQNAEVDSMKLEETSSMVSQLSRDWDAICKEIHKTGTSLTVGETDTNEIDKQIIEVPEAFSEPKNQGVETASDDEIIAPTVATEVTIVREVQQNDEPVKDLDTSSETGSLETTKTADPSQQDEEVDSMKPKETASMVCQLPIQEHEKTGNESTTVEMSDANDVEVDEAKISDAVPESKDQHVREIHETGTSLAMGETDANEIEKQIKKVPEALSEPINQGVQAARYDEITPGQTLHAENIGEQLQLPSSVLLSKEQDSEATTTIEKTEDWSTKKDDTEVDNLKLEENSGMESQLPITERESANNVTVEKSDADEVEVKETITLDAVSESKDQGFEEIHETGTSPTTENAETDKIEEEIKEANEKISDPRYQGVDAVVDGETPDHPLTLGKLQEQFQVSSSALLSNKQDFETRTTIEKKEDETEVDKIELVEATGMLSEFPTIEHKNAEMSAAIEKSEADEVQVEESKTSEAISQLKVRDVEEIHEIGPSLTVGKTCTDEVEEEIKAAPDTIFEPNYQCVEAVIDEDITTNQTLPTQRKDQLQEPSSALPEEQNHDTTSNVELITDESTKKDETQPNENVACSFAASITEKPCLQDEGPRKLDVSNLELKVQEDSQDREEESTALEETSTEEPQEYIPEIKHADCPTENEIIPIQCSSQGTSKDEDIIDSGNSNKEADNLPPPYPTVKELLPGEVGEKCEEASNLEFEKNAKVLESVSEIQSLEVPPISEGTEIIKEQLKGIITELRDGENHSVETTEADEAIKKDTSNEKITEEKPVARDSHPVSPYEETVTKSNQEDELRTEDYPGERTNITFESTRNEIPYEVLFEESEEAGAVKEMITTEDRFKDPYQVSVGDGTANVSPPEEEKDGKNVKEVPNRLDLEIQGDETNFRDAATEATAPIKEFKSSEVIFLASHEKDRTGDNDEETVMRNDEQMQNTDLAVPPVTDAAAEEAPDEVGENFEEVFEPAPKGPTHGTIETYEENKEIASADTNNSENLIDNERLEHRFLEPACEESDVTEDIKMKEQEVSANKPSISSCKETSQEEIEDKESEKTVDKKQQDFMSDKQTTEEISMLEDGKSIQFEGEQTKDEDPVEPSTMGNERKLDEDKIHSINTANEDEETQHQNEKPNILSHIKDSSREVSHEKGIMDLDKVNEITKDAQDLEKTSIAISHEQIVRKANPSEGAETTNLTASKDVPLMLDNPTAKIFQNAGVEDLKAGYASGSEPEAKGVECGEEKRMGEESEETTQKSIMTEPDNISLSDLMQRSTKQTLQVVEHLTEERELIGKKEEPQNETADRVQVEDAKTYEEKDEEDEGDEHKTADSGSDAPVMVEASRDTDVKIAHKKSHSILSGVGSKVKHSLVKMKKVITGKSSHPKPPSSR